MGQNPATKYTPEFRRETADHIIASGRPITECCRELGLNDKTVGKWVVDRRRQLAGQPDPKAESRELREARRRIRELEMENEFLKKASAFFAMLKNEMYHRESFATRDEARRAVVGFIEGYYNRRRPHSSVGYGIPAKLMDALFERTAAAAETAPGEAHGRGDALCKAA